MLYTLTITSALIIRLMYKQSRAVAVKPRREGNNMKVFIKNLYGINDGSKAYYRKQGIGCFDFVNRKEYAYDLTEDEADKIMNHAEYYKKQYSASEMAIEE